MNFGDKDYIMMIAVILFGAIVHATSQLKISRDNKTDFTFFDFVILSIIACFSGLVFGLITILRTDNMIQIILSSAIGSFLGMAGLVKVANIFLEFLVTKSNLSSEKEKDVKI